MKVAIYTAIFGDYDHLNAPARQDIDCDFICFSDRRMPRTLNGWRTVYVPTDAQLHSRMQAKRFKLLNHAIFPKGRLAWSYASWAERMLGRSRYDATIWVDGSLQIKGATFARDVATLATGGATAVFKHPDRDCLYDEVTASAPLKKYEGLPMAAQVEKYRGAGTPENAGLYACGIIGRKSPPNSDQANFDNAWWQENKNWTYQDQLSFAHLVYQMGRPVAKIPGNLWDTPYFDLIAHKSEL